MSIPFSSRRSGLPSSAAAMLQRVDDLKKNGSALVCRLSENSSVEIIKGNIDDFDIAQIKDLIKDCDYIVCCLGHNINLKGIFGPPYKLVFNAVDKIIQAMHSSCPNKKIILMSTTAYTNKKEGETNTSGERMVFSLLEILLPPHKDNMLVADHLI